MHIINLYVNSVMECLKIKSYTSPHIKDKLNWKFVNKLKFEVIVDLITYLVGRTDISRKKRDETRRKVDSLANNLVYVITKSRVKPSKQITLGINFKSLTVGTKIIDLLNKYNQCTNYNIIKELETVLSYSSTNHLDLCPPGVLLLPNVSTSVTFDNFDRYVESSNRKDTLHGTLGIFSKKPKVLLKRILNIYRIYLLKMSKCS